MCGGGTIPPDPQALEGYWKCAGGEDGGSWYLTIGPDTVPSRVIVSANNCALVFFVSGTSAAPPTCTSAPQLGAYNPNGCNLFCVSPLTAQGDAISGALGFANPDGGYTTEVLDCHRDTAVGGRPGEDAQ